MVQAILLADSFGPNFLPITLERPKVLFPIVNKPMIDYTLSWLESEGVIDEVFVLSSSHSDQIIDYLNTSGWCSKPDFRVIPIESPNCISCSSALHFIHYKNMIHAADFILVGGDTVANISLKRALEEHDNRRKKDSSALVTMIIEESPPREYTMQSRLGLNELFMAIDPDTKQLFYYDSYPKATGDFVNTYNYLLGNFLADKPSLGFYQNKQDCYIDICSRDVLRLFSDDFDQTLLRRHFVHGLVANDITRCKTFIYEIKSVNADKVDNLRSYDAISKGIMHRLQSPRVSNVMCAENSASELNKQIKASVISNSRNTQVSHFSVIGRGTKIGNDTTVFESVIGENCVIGSGVSIEGCYIWSNVTIEDGCKLKYALICDNVVLKSGATLKPGVVLSSNVVIGEQFIVPAFSKVSLFQQPINLDCEDLRYVNQYNACFHSSPEKKVASLLLQKSPSQVGAGGAGYIWSIEEDWMHSVAPEPSNKILELLLRGYVDIPRNIGAWKDEDNCSIVSEKNHDKAEEVEGNCVLSEEEINQAEEVVGNCILSEAEFNQALKDEGRYYYDSEKNGDEVCKENLRAFYLNKEYFKDLCVFPW